MLIEQWIKASGLYLPEPARVPSDVILDFAWARVFTDRVYVSGHGPQAADGTIIGPFGRVGVEVTPEQAALAARFATLAVLGSVKRAIGDLDRIAAWLRIDGFVLAGPGFDRTTNVVNGCSRLVAELFGDEAASHARTAIGVAATPLSCPVVIAAELALKV
jgi:enamine deaminase RidA (YjgF/YER057c/UK114 family)